MPQHAKLDRRPFYPTDRVQVKDPETGRVVAVGEVQGANDRHCIVQTDAGALMRVSTGFLVHLSDPPLSPNERPA